MKIPTGRGEVTDMSNPNLAQLNDITKKVLEPSLKNFYKEFLSPSFFLEKLKADGMIHLSEVANWEDPQDSLISLTPDQALEELRGLGYIELTVIQTSILQQQKIELRHITKSSIYGKLVSIIVVSASAPLAEIQAATRQAILDLHQLAKKKLIEGKLLKTV